MPHTARGDYGEILILDADGWAPPSKNGEWHHGILFFHDQIAEFSPVENRDEIYRLYAEPRATLRIELEQTTKSTLTSL